MPVDGESLIRRLAVLLIYQCMSVPIWGTYVLHQHHSFMYITDMSAFYVLTGQVTYRMSQPITAWLSIGSTYSYLTALRINAIQRDMSLNLSVKPISIRAIMKSMDNIPFPPSKKTKVDYMWRDIERRADWYGLPKPKLPAPYPLQAFDQANKIGIVLNQQGRYLEYFEETYRLWFVSGMEAGSEENLRLVLKTMKLDYDDIMHQAKDEAIQQMYEANTEEAKQLGVFGAPSFSIGNEIFWGDDRLEDAIRFAASH